MIRFTRLRFSQHPNTSTGRHAGTQPCLETLEDRNLLSTFFVVRADLADGRTSFGSLQSALAASTDGDIIQMEPNSAPGDGTVAGFRQTVQGDPSFGPASLPLVGTLTINDDDCSVTNLPISAMMITNGVTSTVITHCMIGNIQEQGGASVNGSNSITDNTISGALLLGNSFAPSFATGDQVIDNVFTGAVSFVLETGAIIRDNVFNTIHPLRSPYQNDPWTSAIVITDSQCSVIHNRITMPAFNEHAGVNIVAQSAQANVTVNDNEIVAPVPGIGVYTAKLAAGTLSVSLAGNDFVGCNAGIDVNGDMTGGAGAYGTIDAGGGPLGSLGGNDFHGFGGSLGNQDIVAVNLATPTPAVIWAQSNIFSVSDPNTVVQAEEGSINASNSLTPAQAFVDRLYENFLERPGSVSELNPWVAALPTLGQGGVANTIARSPEALARLVDSLYWQYLGRAATAGDESSWAGFMRAGHTEEDVIAALCTSAEFYIRASTLANYSSPDLPDANFVRALYEACLGRVGSTNEISAWVNALPAVGRAAVVFQIVHSVEFRSDQVKSFYTTFLHRGGSSSEVAGFAESGSDLISMEIVFAYSGEFFANG